MSQEKSTEHHKHEDDQEMLDAISEAFGRDALGLIDDHEGVRDASGPASLDAILCKLDQATGYPEVASEDQQGQKASDKASERFVIGEFGGSRFGIPMSYVLEIQRMPAVTRLPNVPGWVSGVANLRGTVLSVVDVAMMLGMPAPTESSAARRLMVIQSLVDDVHTALIVDRVIGIRAIPKSAIKAPTAPVNERIAAYLLGIGEYDEQLVALVDVEKLLLSEKFRQFETV